MNPAFPRKSLVPRALLVAVVAAALSASACRRAESGAGRVPVSAEELAAGPVALPVAAVSAIAPRDAAALLARVFELGESGDADARRRALAALLSELDDEARAELLEALWRVGDDEPARARFAELFTLWCENDPAAAARWAAEMWDEIPGRDGERLREQAGLLWAARDFAPAFAWALSLRDVGSEWGLAAKMLKQVAQNGDPRRALELARGVSEEFYAAALNRIFAGWVEIDPAAAFAELGEACRSSSMFRHWLGKWADRDPVAAVRWAIERKHESIHSLAGFVKDKGAFVAALYEAKIDWPAGYGYLLPNALNSWLRADQAEALAWIDGLPGGPEKMALIAGGAKYRAYDASRGFIASAAPLIARLPEGEERGDLARQLLAEWGRSDPEAALRWSLDLDDAALHEAALVGAIAGLAKLDLGAARAQLETLPEGPARAQANLNLALGWSAEAGAEAFHWLNETQPDWASPAWRADDMTGRVALLRNALNAEPLAVAGWANTFAGDAPAQYLTGNAIVNLGSDPPWGGGEPLKATLALEAMQPEARRIFLGSLRTYVLDGKRGAAARAHVEASTFFTAEEKAVLLDGK